MWGIQKVKIEKFKRDLFFFTSGPLGSVTQKNCFRFIYVIICQDKFDHDKGQKSAISGRRLHWIFCVFSSIYVQFSKTSPLKSGESSEKSSGENRIKSCHVCGCHMVFYFFGYSFSILARGQTWALCQANGIATLESQSPASERLRLRPIPNN